MNEKQEGLAAAVWAFVEDKQGQEFTAQEVGDALRFRGGFRRAGIRSHLYWLVQTGKLVAIHTTGAQPYRYRERGRQPAHSVLTEAWARIAALPWTGAAPGNYRHTGARIAPKPARATQEGEPEPDGPARSCLPLALWELFAGFPA